jgi:glycosyltransferase involved in cell wall biosynthesis
MNDYPATPSRPTILQVLHTLEVGGAEMLATRIARRLQDRFHFIFACLDGLGTLGKELQDEGFQVEVLGRRPGIDWACVRKLAQFAHDQDVRVIHAHQYTPFFYARAPGWTGRRAPVLFTEHGRVHPDLPNRKRIIFNRLFLRDADRVVAVGESVKRALIANEGIPGGRIQVIYNGVRLADFEEDSRQREEVRRELGFGATTPVAIQVARLDYLKDHFTALRTAERVQRTIPEFQLLLVGEGPERAKIEEEIRSRGLTNTVRLLGLRTDVRRLLAAADLFLLTSISEGIPVTLIEAMSAKLPIVSTDVGGVPEVVTDGETGWTAPAGDDAQLAEGILCLLADRDEARAMALAGCRRAEEQFSEQQMHDAYAALYEEMLPAPRRRRLAALQEV